MTSISIFMKWLMYAMCVFYFSFCILLLHNGAVSGEKTAADNDKKANKLSEQSFYDVWPQFTKPTTPLYARISC